MPQLPQPTAGGDPIFCVKSQSVSQIRSLSRAAGAASERLNSGSRLVNPGDDVLSFSAASRLRSDIGALGVVTESSQLNAATLGLAIDGLDQIKSQVDRVKRSLIQAQAADDPQLALIQQDIDLAITQIDATAQTTRLGPRSLFNGDSSFLVAGNIANDGTRSALPAPQGSTGFNTGVFSAKVNKIGVGAGGSTRTLDDGSRVLSFNVSVLSANTGSRARLQLGAGLAGDFTEFRVTGKYGSTTLRLDGIAPSREATSQGFESVIREFNLQAQETGLALVQQSTGSGVFLQATGYGDDFFVKVEVIDGSADGATIGGVGADNTGASALSQGSAATVLFNGQEIRLGGELGNVARITDGGSDIEIFFGTNGLTDFTSNSSESINIDLSGGLKGLLGASGRSAEVVSYGINNFSAGQLGRAGAVYNTVTDQDGSAGYSVGGSTVISGDVVGLNSVADISSGGALSLGSGRLSDALAVIDLDRQLGAVSSERNSSKHLRPLARLEVMRRRASA